MNEKDFNRAVLSQLYEISAKVFIERVTVHRDRKEVEDEQFTASEIVNGKDSIGRKIEIRFKGEPEVFTVEIDGFKCSFAAEGVFNIVAKFEKLAGISSKKRMKYLKGSCVCEEIVNEKSMYPLSGKATTKKKKLIKLSERTEEEAGTVQNEDKQDERTGQIDELANEPNERPYRYKGIHTGTKSPDGFANTISHYKTDVVKTRPNNRVYVGYLATFGIIRIRGST